MLSDCGRRTEMPERTMGMRGWSGSSVSICSLSVLLVVVAHGPEDGPVRSLFDDHVVSSSEEEEGVAIALVVISKVHVHI